MKMTNTKFRKKLKRFNIPNHARELTFSCYRRYPYFNDPIACEIFLNLLNIIRAKYHFELWSYVVMPNHVHLLIWPKQEGNIVPKVLHYIKGKTAREYKNHLLLHRPEIFDDYCIEKRGIWKFQFWQPGGGYDRNLWSAKAIHSAIEYIEHNPVRARLVSQSDQYRWSSAWARRNRYGLIPDDLDIPMLMKS